MTGENRPTSQRGLRVAAGAFVATLEAIDVSKTTQAEKHAKTAQQNPVQ